MLDGVCIFFFKQKTAYEMRISDWSSDVCSSDLLTQDLAAGRVGRLRIAGSFPIANGDLARAVAEFVIERPKVQVDLQSLTSPQVVDHVVSREVELGVVYGPVANPEVETQVLVRSGIRSDERRVGKG